MHSTRSRFVHSTLGTSQQGSQTSSVTCVLTFGHCCNNPPVGRTAVHCLLLFLSLDDDDSEGDSDEFESDDSDDLMAGAPHKEPSVIIEDITEQEVRQGGVMLSVCAHKGTQARPVGLASAGEQHLLHLCAWLHGSVCNLVGQPSSEVRCHKHS